MSFLGSPFLTGILAAIILVTSCIELATSSCRRPQTPDHSTLIYERHSSPPRRLPNGYIVRVVCDELFSLAEGDDGFMTCRNHRWSNTFVCTAICEQLPHLPKGTITYSAGGTIARYSCTTSGYRLEGIRKRRCQSNGTWSGERPSCRGIPMCERPELEEHVIQRRFLGSKRDNLWIVGTILQFSCEERFIAVTGHYPAIECTRRGWNDTVPICVETGNNCPPLSTPLNGYKTGELYFLPQTTEFSCEPGYTLSGSTVRECMLGGQWSGEEARCVGNAGGVNPIFDVHGQGLDQLATENEMQQPSTNGAQQRSNFPTHHEYGVDLYFVLESSTRVGRENFEKMKRFAAELVQRIGVTRRSNSLRVGALFFSYDAEIAFETDDFRSTDEVIEEGINKIPYRGGGRNIDDALRVVRRGMLVRSQHRAGSYKAVFIMFTGEPNENGASSVEARLLKDAGVRIYCIGVTEDASRARLYEIGSRPHREHVFLLKEYASVSHLVSAVINQPVDFSECGVSENTIYRGRVVGGNDANPGAWPWQALLDMSNGTQRIACGGVLIDRHWILTTASCLPNDPGFSIKVVLGMTELSRPRHQEIEVEEHIPHPGYDPLTFQNDIALLRLQTQAELNAKVRLVCLPEKTRVHRLIPPNPSGNHIAIITGWGHDRTREVNDSTAAQVVDRLQQLALPLKSREDCQASLEGKQEEHLFDESMFCAGYQTALLGACKGDAGGPLVKKAVRQRQRRWTLIGLTSWGRGCAVRDELDFFTNVPYFMDWIEETISHQQEEEEEQEREL